MKIKEGAIFVEKFGIAMFYQVIKVYESEYVRVRRIEAISLKWVNGYEEEVMPDINNFKEEDVYIKDNEKGALKKVIYTEDSAFISFGPSAGATGWLWNKKPVISSYYYIWMK